MTILLVLFCRQTACPSTAGIKSLVTALDTPVPSLAFISPAEAKSLHRTGVMAYLFYSSGETLGAGSCFKIQ